MLVVHDGKTIPRVDPKCSNSDEWFGFEHFLASGESILSSSWLINGVLVSDGESVDGLVFVTSQHAGATTKARLAGGAEASVYRVTNRISTNFEPVRERSFDVVIAQL